ncbi:MAG: hypothetical protein NTU51_09335 [Bacteroidetes bacterium]|nr:hypothetical protein [Bacteroidota bacterium]
MNSHRIAFLMLLFLSILFLPQCKKSSDTVTPVELPGDWQPTNGPGSGLILSLAVSGNALLAGLDGHGLYYSSDAGASWTCDNSAIPNNTSPYAIVPVNDTVVYTVSDKIYQSWNSGKEWHPLAGFSSATISLAINGPQWFAGTSNSGLFSSEDYGSTWKKVNTGLPDSNYVYSIFFHGSTIFAGTYHGGLLVSQDTGKTWHVNSQMPINTVISSFASKGSTIYAGTFNGVWESDDNGQTWLATTLENQEVYDMLIVDNYVFAAVKSWGVYGTTVGSSRWWLFCYGLPYYTTVTSIATDGTLLYAGTKGYGVWTHKLR